MKSENNKSGIYITACCLAVIAAVIGFSGRRANSGEKSGDRAEFVPEVQVQQQKSEPVKETEKIETGIQAEQKEEVKSVAKAEIIEDAHFVRPVDGKILEEFSDNNLIYNETLRDWRTHNGVDLEAESGTQVIAAANGVVEKVYDSNMGKCVEIDHKNGYKTVYANLDENITINQGDEIAEGDVIGLVGNTALGDATDIPHLHFEITKDGENVNPKDYFE